MTLSYGRTKHERGFFRYYEDCGILSNIFAGGVESAFAFCRSALGRLLEYDGENEGDLLATLKLLLETNFNYSATAAELFVHANTVRYRSDKIEQLLMRDLSDPGASTSMRPCACRRSSSTCTSCRTAMSARCTRRCTAARPL